ncbi:hypothetical protein EYM_06455 [Ignicoccus islandicus DSM 13165]|uniref:Anhydromevalonate phosphate decarboxylase n=1 Tax=Ignicoccus islandicus DSM 13165 TaxID=940295 RepID=A0A0U3F7C3_9CREN|nr:UbiD family decarboxylase [Ignicoccus islandicus]ALU11944.1 hypothetical protein EYM_06455 [Ignicoccus islandicus DSM 13165]
MPSLNSLLKELGAVDVGTVDESEVRELIKKYEEAGKPVIYKVKGSDVRVASALYSTRKAVHKALNSENDVDAYKKLIEAKKGQLIETEFNFVKLKDLDDLPWVKFYPKDGGKYHTASIYISCYEGKCNASFHRTMKLDSRRCAVRLVPRHLFTLHKKAIEKGEELPVAVVIGAPSEVEFASALSLPFGVFELEVAAGIAGSLEVARTPIYGLPVPRNSAVVIEGRLTKERVKEGPFVDLLHTYDKVREEPVLEVDAVYWNPTEPLHLILPGGREHQFLMGYPREASIWDSVRKVVPEVHKVRLTPGGGMWLHAVISITKASDGDAKNALLAAFAGHPSLKHAIVVDEDVDPDDLEQVEWAIATRFQAKDDLIVINNARGSSLDPSSNGLTSKVGIDATRPIKERDKFERVY